MGSPSWDTGPAQHHQCQTSVTVDWTVTVTVTERPAGAEHPTPSCIWGVPPFALLSFRDPLALHIPASRGWRKQHMTQAHTQYPWGLRRSALSSIPSVFFFLCLLLKKFFVCLHHLYNRKQLTLHNAHSKALPIQLKPEASLCFPENEGSSGF